MDHGANASTWRTWALTSGVPARLDVTIDPAAHGPAGIGPLSRGVMVTTSAGQELEFTLTARVTAS
jgi:hypothetical protein